MPVTFETTPNPATMKFKFDRIISKESKEFLDVQSTDISPLAAKLFGFPWTSAVFLGEDFVTVTKQDWVEWEILASPLAGLLDEHIESGQPILVKLAAAVADENESDSDVVKQIKRILKTDIKPVVALDGGDIVFVYYENQILQIRMQGACSGCPSSQATLKDGIEVRMKELVPEIKEVVAV